MGHAKTNARRKVGDSPISVRAQPELYSTACFRRAASTLIRPDINLQKCDVSIIDAGRADGGACGGETKTE